MRWPESSGKQPVAVAATVDAPMTLRKSRRLTGGSIRSAGEDSAGGI